MAKAKKPLLKGDKAIRHRAWFDLGNVLSMIEVNAEKSEIIAAIDKIRRSLFVPGNHNTVKMPKDASISDVLKAFKRMRP
jgi:hypothetical protein